MQLLEQIQNHPVFSGCYLKVDHLAEPFYQKTDMVKAIVLGADPSNPQDKTFEYVFGLEQGEKSPYFSLIQANLKHLGLDLSTIYVQNLCRNYFKDVTDKNPYYVEIAKEFWLPVLKEELDGLFPPAVPVFVTAWKVMEVVAPQSRKYRHKKSEIYRNAIIFNENELNRPVIALFRGGRGYYNLNKQIWQDYKRLLNLKLPKDE